MHKELRKLILQSKSGDYSASGLLAEKFEKDFSDTENAEHYKNECANQLATASLRLSSIRLVNYRGFSNIEIPFNTKRNTFVIVGNNGSGKSSVLEAIHKSLTHFVSRLATKSYNGDPIHPEFDISIGAEFSTITPIFEIGPKNMSFEIAQNKPLSTVRKSSFTELNEVGKLFRMANTIDESLSFPLLASYTVERANDVTTKDIEESEEILNEHSWDKSKAYNKSLSGKADFKLFFRWFKEQIERENQEYSDLKVLKEKISTKESELNSPLMQSMLNQLEGNDVATQFLEKVKNEINDLKNQLNEQSDVNNKSLDNVREAIYKFLPEFSDLKLKRTPLDMVVKKKGLEFSVLQLSQGEKSLLALVADIARRLTILNPKLENPLDGTGLVLIDEIDLHLHPSWQQKILNNLEITFPNLQFIVTTHSPQVCHTLDSECIWLLKDGKKFKAPRGVRAGLSSWVLENLFGVGARPREDDMTILLEEYKELVYADEYHSAEAIKKRAALIENFGQENTAIIELDLYIENKEWEKEFDKD